MSNYEKRVAPLVISKMSKAHVKWRVQKFLATETAANASAKRSACNGDGSGMVTCVAATVSSESIWWVPYVLAKCKQIVTAVNTQYHKWMYKYRSKFQRTIWLCANQPWNGNMLWQEAICLEMAKDQIAFQTLNENESNPPTYQQICCHMVYNVKMEDSARRHNL
jgi:hypothetical protein